MVNPFEFREHENVRNMVVSCAISSPLGSMAWGNDPGASLPCYELSCKLELSSWECCFLIVLLLCGAGTGKP